MELLPVSVVERWFNAINARDYEQLFSVIADDVEVMTATGCYRGPAAIDEWLDFTAEPFRWFCGPPGLVVVEQVGCWLFPPTSMERVIASAFRVFNGRIVRYRRFDDLSEALAATCLTDEDEVLTSGVVELSAVTPPRHAARATGPGPRELEMRQIAAWMTAPAEVAFATSAVPDILV
jgi:hypothetical protein